MDWIGHRAYADAEFLVQLAPGGFDPGLAGEHFATGELPQAAVPLVGRPPSNEVPVALPDDRCENDNFVLG
jgi:hypothetical protein